MAAHPGPLPTIQVVATLLLTATGSPALFDAVPPARRPAVIRTDPPPRRPDVPLNTIDPGEPCDPAVTCGMSAWGPISR